MKKKSCKIYKIYKINKIYKIYRVVAQKSRCALWPTVARNISIGAPLFFDGDLCNNTWKIRFCSQNFPACFYLKSRKPAFSCFFAFATNICISRSVFYGLTIFLVCLHHWIEYYSTVPKPEIAKLWLRFVGLVSLNHRLYPYRLADCTPTKKFALCHFKRARAYWTIQRRFKVVQ